MQYFLYVFCSLWLILLYVRGLRYIKRPLGCWVVYLNEAETKEDLTPENLYNAIGHFSHKHKALAFIEEHAKQAKLENVSWRAYSYLYTEIL